MMSMVETTAVEFRAEYSRAKLVIGKSDEEENPSASPTSEASTESSSIGQPDDEDEDEDEDEVQSTLSSLEDSLPIKRGLSKFYTGKSKSFANVTEVRNVKELGKSENPFNKRRRSLMAYNLMFKEDKNNNNNNSSKKKKSFYSHSNHISMPLLPLAEDEDESSDAEEYYAPTASFRLHQIKEHRPYHTNC